MQNNDIGRSRFQSKIIEDRHTRIMLQYIEDYELVKSKQHQSFNSLEEFYRTIGLCRQNFLKYYRRYLNANKDISVLMPKQTGRKYRDSLQYEPEIIDKLQEVRSKGYNRYETSFLLAKHNNIEISPSSIYRLFCKLNINKLDPKITEEKIRIIKMNCGELGHVDIHYLTKGLVKECNNKKLYLLGVIDSYSRVCWLEVIDSIKAINVAFATMNILLNLNICLVPLNNGRGFGEKLSSFS